MTFLGGGVVGGSPEKRPYIWSFSLTKSIFEASLTTQILLFPGYICEIARNSHSRHLKFKIQFNNITQLQSECQDTWLLAENFQCFLAVPESKIFFPPLSMISPTRIDLTYNLVGIEHCSSKSIVVDSIPIAVQFHAIDPMHNDVTRLDAREECWSL